MAVDSTNFHILLNCGECVPVAREKKGKIFSAFNCSTLTAIHWERVEFLLYPIKICLKNADRSLKLKFKKIYKANITKYFYILFYFNVGNGNMMSLFLLSLIRLKFFVIKIKTKYKAYELEIHVFPLEVIFL